MAILYSEEELLGAIGTLDHARLEIFVSQHFIEPLRGADGRRLYDPVARARIELLCELAEDFNLEDDALGIIISLIDQLHAARADLARLAGAIEAEPLEVRRRIGAALCR